MLGPALQARVLVLWGMQVSKQSKNIDTNLKFFLLSGLEGEVYPPKLHQNFHWELLGRGLYLCVCNCMCSTHRHRQRGSEQEWRNVAPKSQHLFFTSYLGITLQSLQLKVRVWTKSVSVVYLSVYCSLVPMSFGSQSSPKRPAMN